MARSLDERIADGWPAAETEVDIWQYRWTYGVTRRANSALALAAEPKYPTAALGTIDLSIERWDEVSPGCGTLAAFVTATQRKATS